MSRNALKKNWLVMGLVGSVFVSMAAEGIAQDTITLKRRGRRGSKILGEITEVSRTSIKLKTGDGTKSISVNEVQRISLNGEPSGLRQARTAVLAGQYEQAITALDGLRVRGNLGGLIRQEIGYYRAIAEALLALQGNGDLVEAKTRLNDHMRNDPQTFHFFEAVEVLGDLSKAVGDYDDTAKYYTLIGKAPWPDYELRGQVLLGNALRSQAQWKSAILEFDKALSANAADPASIRQQSLARIGKAACQAELGEASQAISDLQDVIAKHDTQDGELFAQAYLALGAAHAKLDQPMDAVLAYLHVDLLFYKQRSAHAEALFHLAELWPVLEQPSRGIESRRMLQARYGGSVWAKKSK